MRIYQIILLLLVILPIAATAGDFQTLQHYTETSLVTISTEPCANKMRWQAVEYIGSETKVGCWYKRGDKVLIDGAFNLTLDIENFELAVNH